MFCGKCGKTIPDGYQFCMNCGTKIETVPQQNIEEPVIEQYPVEEPVMSQAAPTMLQESMEQAEIQATMAQETGQIKEKKLKKGLIAIVVILLVIAIAGVFFFVNINMKKSGLYKGIPWESSYNEVWKKLEKKAVGDLESNDEKSIIYENVDDYNGDQDVNATIAYVFEDGKSLYSVMIFVRSGESSKYTDSGLLDKYEKELTKLYGKGKQNSGISTWETSKTEISLSEWDGVLLIMYTDINHQD